ncbi:MAG: hypothetical protein SFX74_08060 [Fimbriimonadaceae bacterium]|nr:hypothetical protein [Fimbriimonadaceae bacterium]
MTSYAVIATGPGQVEFGPVQSDEPGPDDVVIELTHSWISNGTEGSFLRGERIAGDTARRNTDPLPFPHVPGYQSVGTVVARGRHVAEVAEGQRVFATLGRLRGMFYPFGGHVSPLVCAASEVIPVPDGVTSLAASGLTLMQVGWNAAHRALVASGTRALVIGDGLLGIWTSEWLAERGAHITVLGRHTERLRHAAGIGVSAWEDVPETLDLVIHTAGDIHAVRRAMARLVRTGQLVTAGFLGAEGALDLQELRDQEISIHAISGWTRPRLERTLAGLAAGHVSAESLVTHRFPARCAATAYDLILAGSAPSGPDARPLGVVLEWAA